MKEVIWFFGSSTAGKKTLIEFILKNAEAAREKFHIGNEKIIANKEALIWITKKNHNERLNLVSKIEEDFKDECDTSLLVKGQSCDLKNMLLDNIKNNFPAIQQKIIFVYTEPKEELERLKAHRAWYTPDITEEYVLEEINYQLPFLNDLQSQGIMILCVNGGSDRNYEIIDFPPIK